MRLNLNEDEVNQVRAALSERLFERKRYLIAPDTTHDPNCKTYQMRQERDREINGALMVEIATLEGLLARLPGYEKS